MTAIKFTNVGKQYKRDGIPFWALKNINLDVERGEIVGIVGQNGSGKSTMLKVVSRVTLPTEGKIDICGKTGSLLEVGTGFHPELTGMENIYFNGAIIGIPRKEINDKLDDIIKFSGVEEFINTPVKRYSSGMYTRLAFAVAAHLDVENMFIDEVLAVGDAEFQRKCLSKMDTMSKGGRTILFVSHDMAAITRLCNKCVWLHHGESRMIGDPNEVVQAYITHTVPRGGMSTIPELIKRLPEDPTIKINDVIINQNGKKPDVIFSDYALEISVNYTIMKQETGLRIFIRILDDNGNLVMRGYHDEDPKTPLQTPGRYCSSLTIPPNLLAHRNYEISVGALIFNQRACTGNTLEGIRIPIGVEMLQHHDQYPEEAYQYRPAIEPKRKWITREI